MKPSGFLAGPPRQDRAGNCTRHGEPFGSWLSGRPWAVPNHPSLS
jgi:hypothetical protein